MRQVAKKGLLTAVATGSVLASTAGYAYAAGADAHGTAANSPGAGSGNSVQVPLDVPVNACGNTVNVVGLLNPAYGNSCGNVSGGEHSGGDHAGSGSDAAGSHGAGSAGAGSGGAGNAGAGNGGAGNGGAADRGAGGSGTTAGGGASAEGGAHGSPGVLSGNSVQTPVHAPVNACGNTVNVVGAGNPAFGNECANQAGSESKPPTPPPGEDCPPETGGTGGEHTPPPGTDRSGTPTVEQTTLTSKAEAAPAAGRLASTGVSGIEWLAPTGAALLLGGGVLYRRSRAGAR